jgi:hypothetical protein
MRELLYRRAKSGYKAKKSYKELIPANRRIKVVEGFYEWMHIDRVKALSSITS